MEGDAVERTPPTRMALLAKRAQIRLAEQGRDLLISKRAALLKELQALAARVLAGSERLDQIAATARRSLVEAEALDGPEAVRAAALATRRSLTLQAQTVSIMGVRLPDIVIPPVNRALLARGYGLTGATPRIDAAAEAFEALLDLGLRLAAQEVKLRRLSQEIRVTTRRINVLDQEVIPRLRAERDAIEAVLAERERETIFRLKRLVAARRAREEA